MPLASTSEVFISPDCALEPDSILHRTLNFLLSKGTVRSRRITEIYLNNYFTVIRLDDDSVGACMSSFRLSAAMLESSQQHIRTLLPNDPLLMQYIRESRENAGITASLKAALANALSAPMLRVGGDEFFGVVKDRPNDFFADIDYAVVIGWGGIWEFLLKHTTALRIHASDLKYQAANKERIEVELSRYRSQYPYLELSVSDGSDIRDHLAAADFLAITGSTLGNSTLDELLNLSQNCRRIILQGQSAGIHPRYLFNAGIHLVATSIKPVTGCRGCRRRPDWENSASVFGRGTSSNLPQTNSIAGL